MKQCRATFNLCLHKRRWSDLTQYNTDAILMIAPAHWHLECKQFHNYYQYFLIAQITTENTYYTIAHQEMRYPNVT